MKGIVFAEFLRFVAARHGEDMVDDIIDDCDLPSGGAYTTVGTYDHAEILALCTALGARTGRHVGDVVRDFGTHLSTSFSAGHPDFFARSASFFDFLESVEGHIHVEVRKLYPDAELPTFQVEQRTPTRLVLVYRSPRRMGILAEGLILGSAAKFGVEASVQTVPIDAGDGQATRFVIDIVPAPAGPAAPAGRDDVAPRAAGAPPNDHGGPGDPGDSGGERAPS